MQLNLIGGLPQGHLLFGLHVTIIIILLSMHSTLSLQCPYLCVTHLPISMALILVFPTLYIRLHSVIIRNVFIYLVLIIGFVFMLSVQAMIGLPQVI